MTWWRVRFPVDPSLAEAAAYLLAGALDAAIEIQDETTMIRTDSTQAYMVVVGLESPPTPDFEAQIRRILTPLGVQPNRFETQAHDDTWRDGWRAFFQPCRLSRRVGVRPPWEESAGTEVEVVIDPGLAFGTGTHATTRGVMKVLDQWLGDRAPVHILDVGCGSGILSIAAARLGHEATGVEIDESAVASARENVTLNGVDDRVSLIHGDAGAVDGQYPLVVANILAKILIEIAPSIRARCNGDLILSGLLPQQRADVLVAYDAVPMGEGDGEMVVIDELQEGEWLVLLLRRRT